MYKLHHKAHNPKFKKTYCSQCGKEFGPGDHGFSSCIDHRYLESSHRGFMDRLKYFRSQLVPSDIGTTVYWADRWDGESFDIDPSDIPDNEIVIDVTYDMHHEQYIKRNGIYKKLLCYDNN